MNLKQIWKFIWYDDSLLAWFLNLIVAFIIVKFIIYPCLGFALSTDYPVVAVVSGSMEHPDSFNSWWDSQEKWYTSNNISLLDFKEFPLSNGFNKGDIIVLTGLKEIKLGDVIVFQGNSKNPIIHRVVKINNQQQYTTKGDNNHDSSQALSEVNIPKSRVLGTGMIRIPLLGWIKILFTDLLLLFF